MLASYASHIWHVPTNWHAVSLYWSNQSCTVPVNSKMLPMPSLVILLPTHGARMWPKPPPAKSVPLSNGLVPSWLSLGPPFPMIEYTLHRLVQGQIVDIVDSWRCIFDANLEEWPICPSSKWQEYSFVGHWSIHGRLRPIWLLGEQPDDPFERFHHFPTRAVPKTHRTIRYVLPNWPNRDIISRIQVSKTPFENIFKMTSRKQQIMLFFRWW